MPDTATDTPTSTNTFGDLSGALGTPVETQNSAVNAAVTPPAPLKDDLATLQPSIAAAQQATAQDMPRLSRVKASLAGFLMSGLPGAAVGAIDPKAIQSEITARQQAQHFASLKAAADVARVVAETRSANLASDERQAQLDLLHQSTALWAKRMGFEPTVTVSGSNPQDYDASAQAALSTVRGANGGLIPSVFGTNSTLGTGASPNSHETAVYAPGSPTSMKGILAVTEPGAHTVPHLVAEYYRAQGLPTPNDTDWANLGVKPENAGPAQGMTADAQVKAAQREKVEDASRFFMTTPQLSEGGSPEQTASRNNAILQTMKNQLQTYKAAGGNDPDTLRQLQTRIDVVDQGAKDILASGTAAKVASINATAGPEARAAAQKAGAEAQARFPYEQKLETIRQQVAQATQLNKDAQDKIESNVLKPYQEASNNLAEAFTSLDLAAQGNSAAARAAVFKLIGVAQPPGTHRITPAETAAFQSLGGVDQRVLGALQNISSGVPLTAQQIAGAKGWLNSMQVAKDKALNQSIDNVNRLYGTNVGQGLKKNNGPVAMPVGATMKVPGNDGKLHWSDGKRDLGIAQ